ncbi:DUF167 family protein [Devosia subaequoris]|nr:DUF167 family protein [Devosia subaequoris]MCP1210766.1 DUF167 family protein [Devosia subaequoris]
MPGFARQTATGLLLYLRVTPNAGRDTIEGSQVRADGSVVLRVRVSAVPDKGRANAAVIALIAKALGAPKTSISLVSGDTGRLKTVSVAGPAPALFARASALAG